MKSSVRMIGVVVAVFLVGVGIVLSQLWHSHQRHVAAETATYNHFQQLMGLTPLNTNSKVAAPNFVLTDQNGKSISLSALRGKIVVLEFMDPVCTDICPIVSKEILQASAQLGAKSANVEFLAVNVNQYHETTKDTSAFTKEQGLNTLHNWHFLTGSTVSLQRVWKAYGIQVIPNASHDVQHSSFMYFIDPAGNQAYIANPDDVKANVFDWGQGIAYVISRMQSV